MLKKLKRIQVDLYLYLRRCQMTCLSGEMCAIISVFIVFISASISPHLQTCTYHNAIYCEA